MEDKTLSETTPPPAARTADILRELHDRARSALLAQRERMSKLESHLTQQLDSIANTVAEQVSADGVGDESAHLASLENFQLRDELQHVRAEWQIEREQLLAQNAAQAQRLNEQQAELDRAREQTSASGQDFDARQQALDERTTELNHRERELGQRQELLDVYAEQCAAQQSQLTATESALDKQRQDIAAREATVQFNQAEVDRARSDLEQREQTWRNGLSELCSQRESLAAERESLATERAALAAQRESVNEQLAKSADSHQRQGDEVNAQLADAQRQLLDERAAWDRERSNVEEQRRLLAKERDELATALDAARIELAAAREMAATGGSAARERDELQQKFDLALGDVQRLRGRVTDLEQDLASRPAPDQSQSVELVHLRAERDALAEQVAALEARPSAPTDEDSDQQRAELQRRFELAVEDVRDLKKRNTQLESQLVTAASGAPASATAGASSWETMKRQMLADLEGDGDDIDIDTDRRSERSTIQNTIRITDDAMAAKDREIAELRTRLAEQSSAEPNAEHAVQQLVDADAVIAAHRTQIAQLEVELRNKLRTAELELSVERATLAREKAQLEVLKAELDSLRASGEAPATPGVAQQPKRRWLSKLGLTGDEPT